MYVLFVFPECFSVIFGTPCQMGLFLISAGCCCSVLATYSQCQTEKQLYRQAMVRLIWLDLTLYSSGYQGLCRHPILWFMQMGMIHVLNKCRYMLCWPHTCCNSEGQKQLPWAKLPFKKCVPDHCCKRLSVLPLHLQAGQVQGQQCLLRSSLV